MSWGDVRSRVRQVRGQAKQGKLEAGTTLEQRAPSRPAELVADLLVPIGQAVFTGALLGGLVVFVASRTRYEGDLWALWLGVALAVATVTWVLLLMDSRRLLWALERATGLDINRDGTKGKPGERVVIVGAARGQLKQQQEERAETQSQFARFVKGIPVKGTDLRTWEPIMGRETYQDYRDALIRIGWARWRSIGTDGKPRERQGWELVVDPEEILDRISG